MIEVERSHSFGEENVRVLRSISRYDQTPTDLVVALEDEGYAVLGDAATARENDQERRFLEALQQLEKAKTAELAEALDMSGSTVRRIGNRLFAREEIGRTGSGGKTDPHVWHVADLRSTTPDSLVAERKQRDLFEGADGEGP